MGGIMLSILRIIVGMARKSPWDVDVLGVELYGEQRQNLGN
jgi:hypothetical protein